MTCPVVDQQEIIPKYLNGQLDPAAQDDFETHVLECRDCQDAVELFHHVREQLEARAHEIRSYPVARRTLWWSWRVVAACCVVAVVIGIRQMGVHKHARTQTAQQQISAPKTAPPPDVQTAGAGSGSSPSAPAGKQAGETGSGSPQIAVANGLGLSAPSGKGEPGTVKTQTPDHTSPPSGSGPGSSETRFASASDNGSTATPKERSTTGTPDQNKVATAGSPGNLTPHEGTAPNPAVAINTTSPGRPVANEIAQLAAVRPLPYSFAGLAASAPTGGGSTRGSHSSTSAVSGTASNPQAGTGGFSTAQDYFRDGMTAYVDRRYEAAADLLGQAVRLDPQFGEASLYLGICALLQGKTSDAVSPLQSASHQKKPAIAQAAHFYLAKAYLKLSQLADADGELHAAAALPGRLTGEANALIQRLEALQPSDTNP